MASEQARDLRQRGIAAAKAGDKEQARQLLQQSVRLEPGSESAWLWLASVARDGRERLYCLEKVLEINPANETAQKAVQAAQGDVPSAPVPPVPNAPAIRPIGSIKPIGSSSPSPQPAAPAAPAASGRYEPSPQAPGIPVPPADRLADAQKQAEIIARDYQNQLAATPENVKWTHKNRNRAGERDVLFLRAQVSAAVISFIAIVGILGTLFVLNNPDARALLFEPTWTPTFTPTVTATSTPGVTPTPSPTPQLTYTPSPTVPPDITPYNVYFPPRPTQEYPRADTAPLRSAIALVEANRISAALPTLDAEVESVSLSFNPVPYYYQAIAFARNGNGESALRTLEEAEGRLTASTTNSFKPIIDAGYAVVYAELARQAFADDNGAQARDYLSNIEGRAADALERDPRNPDTYLALSRRFSLDGNYSEAITVLSDALERSELQTNVELIIERGQNYFEQGEYDLALYDAFLALYINEGTEAAHLLRIQTALRQNDPGLAVLYAQTYLYYYPGSVLGYKLLGDARLAENKPELALEAYAQGLEGPESDPLYAELLAARGRIFAEQGRYDQARDDFTRALDLTDDPQIRADRMTAAFRNGNYPTALEDVLALRGTDVVPDGRLSLIEAQITSRSADEGDEDAYQQVLTLLNSAGGLTAEEQANANALRAYAQFQLGNLSAALEAVDSALATGETGYRHYVRGLILEAQGDEEEAIREYEWVVTWGSFYNFEFRFDAEERLSELRDEN